MAEILDVVVPGMGPGGGATAGVLVGAESAGPAGHEVRSALILAFHARIPVSTLRRMIYADPTFYCVSEDARARLE